jgi:O-antigen/teichoic acid export membrane protein
LAGRYLGVEDFGRFSFAMAFVFLFDPIMDPGLYHLLIREIARKKEDAELYLSHAITWKILLSPLVFLVLAVGVNIIHDDKQIVYSVYLMAFASFLRSFKDAFRTSLMANEYFGLNTTTMIVERGLLFSFGTLSLIAGKGLLWLCWIFVIARVIDLVITVLIVRYKICHVSVGRDIKFMRNMVISAVPIGAFYITLNIYNYVDTVLLSIIRTNAEVGWYNASYKIYEGLFLFPGILCTVFMPRLSTLFKKSIASFQHLMIRGMKYVFCLSLLITINGVILSDKIITIFYGNAYSNSIISMNILLVGALFVFTLNFLHMVMISMDKQRVILSLAIFGLFLNVILNIFLIQKYGYLGAAFATVAVESILLRKYNFYE